jgi:hypothetical protein
MTGRKQREKSGRDGMLMVIIPKEEDETAHKCQKDLVKTDRALISLMVTLIYAKGRHEVLLKLSNVM